MVAVPICFRLERQPACRAFSRAWAKTGKRIAARMAMIAITTSNSISVKPLLRAVSIAHSLGLRDGRRFVDDRDFSIRMEVPSRCPLSLPAGRRALPRHARRHRAVLPAVSRTACSLPPSSAMAVWVPFGFGAAREDEGPAEERGDR